MAAWQRWWQCVVGASFMVCSQGTMAAPSDPIADIWVIKPVPGQRPYFEQALKEHLSLNQSKSPWRVYVPVTGDDLNHYMLYRCCITWREFDGAEREENNRSIQQNWNSFVDPFVQQVSRYPALIDEANSLSPVRANQFRYAAVTQYRVEIGQAESVRVQLAEMSELARAMGLPIEWHWAWQLGGELSLSHVVFTDQLSDPEMLQFHFEELLAKHLDDKAEAARIVERWNRNFSSSQFRLMRLRLDLSQASE